MICFKLPVDQAEHTAVVLVEYGQMLFRSGFPCYRFSEAEHEAWNPEIIGLFMGPRL